MKAARLILGRSARAHSSTRAEELLIVHPPTRSTYCGGEAAYLKTRRSTTRFPMTGASRWRRLLSGR